MHGYLKAVGLGTYDTRRAYASLIEKVTENPDVTSIVQTGQDSHVAVLFSLMTEASGLAVCGEYEEDEHFRTDFAFPFVRADAVSSTAPCSVQRRTGGDGYEGLCDDYRIGMPLIFHLNNFARLLQTGRNPEDITSVSFSGLASDGKILLPTFDTADREKTKVRAEERTRQIEQAMGGDQQAMERLSFQEMNLFATVNSRLQKEDLYSVIESFFMPSGMETDQYALMGEITACTPWENRMTGAKGWFLEVTAADIPVRVSIAADDLMGDPQPGRRFKGNIWLQGTVEC